MQIFILEKLHTIFSPIPRAVSVKPIFAAVHELAFGARLNCFLHPYCQSAVVRGR